MGSGCLAHVEGVTVGAERAAEPSSALVLMQMAHGFMVAKAVQAAAVLGIADLLADGPRSVSELAAATSTDESSLARLLRALASRDIFCSDPTGKYLNTVLSEALRRDVAGSVRDYVIFAPHNGNVLAWTELDHVLRTGEPSFARANGVAFWDYFADHPDIEIAFNRAMTAMSVETNRLIVEHCDFSRFDSIIDLGGGEGRLLAAILTANPLATGTLLDLPTAIEGARQYYPPRVSPTAPTSSPAIFSHRFPPGTTPTFSSTSCTIGQMTSRSRSCASAAVRWVRTAA